MPTTTYALYLESGPKRRKTMVHALDLLGCVAIGPTTEEALAATPEAIRAYLRFLRHHDEPGAQSPDAPFTTEVAEHLTEGAWMGNGSPYILFGPDLEPVTEAEMEVYLRRARWLSDALADWAASQTAAELDAQPAGGGRTARAVLLHTLGSQGAYLAAALGSAPGFSKLAGAAERGQLDLADALRQSAALVAERAHATTPEQRSALRALPAGPRTLHQAFRRILEHNWEHLAELARRPGGPAL